MAEPKSASPATPAEAAPHDQETAPPAKRKKLSKMEAVRRALDALGSDAKPLEIQAHIQKKNNIAMSTDHISTYKGDIARKKAKAAAALAEGEPQPTETKPPPAARKAVHGADSILLEDVLAAKGLLDRVGAEQLRILINGLAK